MDEGLAQSQTIDRAARRRTRRTLLPQPLAELLIAAHRDGMNQLAVESEKVGLAGLTEAHRLFQHRVEHRG